VKRGGADGAPEVARDELIGRFLSPYLFAPVIGASAVLAFRELLWSPYEAWPIRVLAVVFIVVGLLGMRVPATLGLSLVGVCSVIKPFVLPPLYNGMAASPTSENGLHYLGPGLVTLFVAAIFLSATFAMDEWRSALRALKVRLPVLVLALAGAAAAHLHVGQPWIALAEENKPHLAELEELTRAACAGELPLDMQASLANRPTHHRTYPAGLVPNTLVAECPLPQDDKEYPARVQSIERPHPLRHLAFFKAALEVPDSRYHRGANELNQIMYQTLLRYEYLVIHNGIEVVLVGRKARTVQRRFELVISNPSTEWKSFLEELETLPVNPPGE
jgi:hypothetical protein